MESFKVDASFIHRRLVHLTRLDAVDDSEEGVSVPPAATKVPDLDAELVRDLRPAPLQQGLLGAQLPLVLRGGAAAAELGRGRAAVVLRLPRGLDWGKKK